ncbi:hypothetical protein HX747_30330 [Streptomyces sp. L06]|nr:hypothetical protein [Streptomyces sp. L06]
MSRQDTADAVLLVILAVGWLAWITFAVALLVEVPAQVRGRRAVRLPGLRLSQRAAGVLVTGVLAVLSSTAVASAAPSPGPAATAEAEPGPSQVTSGSPATAERGHEAEGTEQADEAPAPARRTRCATPGPPRACGASPRNCTATGPSSRGSLI